MPLVPFFEAIREYRQRNQIDLVKAAEIHAQQEDSIAACMKTAGFAYAPAEYRPQTDFGDFDLVRDRDYLAVPSLPKDRQLVERYGYGQYSPPEKVATDQATKENLAYRDGLTEPARQAYLIALVGQATNQTEDGTQGLPGGCVGAAREQFPDPASPDHPFMIANQDLLAAMAGLRRQDLYLEPEVVALNDQWRSCMAEKNFPEAGSAEATSPLAGPHWAWYRANGLDQAPPPSPEVAVKLALADFDCRNETGYVGSFVAVQRAVEQRFVDQHSSRLDDLLAELKNP